MFDLTSVNSLSSFGLYRDDGLAVLNRSIYENEKVTKRIRNIFKSEGFKISVDCNLIQTDFLYITWTYAAKLFNLIKKTILI